ncbi:MAG: beta strand repeat-containing protein [Bacteroidota bacterium]
MKRMALLCAVLLMSIGDDISAQVISTSGAVSINNTSGTVIVTNIVENNSGSTLDNGGTITTADLTNAGTLQGNGTYGISGAFTSSGTFTIGTSTVDFNGSGAQSIPGISFYNLTSSSSGTRTLPNGGTIGIAGAFTPGANSFTVTNSTVNFNGGAAQAIPAFNYNNLTSSSTGARTLANSGTIGVAGTFTKGTNSYTVTGSTVDYNSSSSQTITSFTYNNLTLTSGVAVTKVLGGAVTVNGNLTVNANNSLNDAGFQITGNAGGTLSLAAGTTLTLGTVGTATTFPTAFINANITLNSTSTVVYNSDLAQTISAVPTYGNLTLTATSSVTKTISSAATVATDLTVGTNNILTITGAGSVQINTGNLILNGSLDNSGTIDIGL